MTKSLMFRNKKEAHYKIGSIHPFPAQYGTINSEERTCVF